MHFEEHKFVYVNPPIYLLLFLPVFVVYVPALMVSLPHGPSSLVACGLLGPVLFFGWRAALHRLLYRCFTFRGRCLLWEDRMELHFRFTKVRLRYEAVWQVAFRTLRYTTCLTIATKW